MMNLSIRPETEKDYSEVEALTREAFWNLYMPGCDEHYLVHTMRTHPDFIADLDLVAVTGDQIIGSILYTRSYLQDEDGHCLETVTFGPLSVLPGWQRQGVGTALIQHSKKLVLEKGQAKAIIIYGDPHNYCRHGFKNGKDYQISDLAGKFPCALLVLALDEAVLAGHAWKYHASEAYDVDPEAASQFDQQFPVKPKGYQASQEEFRIISRAYLE